MKGQFSSLLKKQLLEEFSFIRRKKQVDVLGILLSLFLAVFFIGFVAYIFSKFIPVYSSITYNHIFDPSARQFEILAVVYSAVLITGIFSAVRNINLSIFESDDVKILVYLPVKPTSLLLTKLIGVYMRSLFTTVLIVLPVNIIFGIVSDAPLYYGVMTVVVCLILPLLNIFIATILSLPAYYIKRILGGKYLLTMILIALLLGVIFWGYSGILSSVKSLFEQREIRLFFNNDTMTAIINATKFLYPANLVANILLKRDMLFSTFVLIGIIVLSSAIGFLIVKYLLSRAMQQHYQRSVTRFVYHKRQRNKRHTNVFFALVNKEFLSVLRVPSYAFQYFVMAIIMPLMVYFSLSLLISLVQNLMFIDCSFELCIFVITIFSVLTNTFCATNISRDGKMFFYSKTLPYSHRQMVFSKLFFCGVVSVISLLACSIMIGALDYVSAGKAVFTFFVTLCLSFAQIAFATRMDFNHPHFSIEDGGEIKESNSTISTIIVLGLIFAVIIGGLSLFLSLFIKLKYPGYLGNLTTYLIVAFCAIVMLGSGIGYLLKGLGKKYYEGEYN
ncbi:MAG TPA: hypothetical protein VJZ69_03595 [Clostridia bacterium]|nr:hypothetical protein [Clostridia bacterium]